VAYAHHVGVVHCDLKPANIMIGKYGETFVLDWGLATNFERTTTFFSPNEPTMRPHSGTGGSSSGQRGGTYGYSSPEQLLTDGPIGPTSDVYSLGATLYEILTGQSPFNGRDPNVREQIRTGEFPLPRRLQPDLCPRLEAICLKAMSLAPHARYATAKLLADDITNWMRDEEIEATPDRWFDRLSRFGRRHRGITAAFFVTLITVILTAAWTDRTVKLAEHERENAANERALREKSDELRSAKDKAMQDEKQGFTIALDAFENLCRPFINGEMNNLGVFHRFVQTINNFTTEYLAKFQDNETMQIHTARVYELKATVSQINDNDVQSALKDLRLAEGIYRKLPPTAVERYARDLRLAQNHLSQGRLLIDTQNWEEAQRVCEATVVELRQLQSAQPASTEILRHLAEAHHYLGEVFLNRPGEGPVRDQALITSQGHFAESKAIREKLVSSTTGEESRNHIRDLARSTGYLGDLYLAQGDIPKALTAYQDSKERRAELYRTKSDDPEHRIQYARGLANFGRLERGYRGELTPAIKSLEQAAAIQQELMDDFPEMEKFALEFADTQNVLAEVYLLAAVKEPERKMEFHKLARESARKASDIFGRPDQQKDPSSVAALAQSLVCMALDSNMAANEAKQHAEDAEKQLRSLFPEQKLNSSELVTLAMARAMQGNIDGAMRALNMAVKRGENTAYRFQEHQQLAFKAIADDEEAAKELKALIGKIRDKLVF
jgi:serine/threonine-protein kinase